MNESNSSQFDLLKDPIKWIGAMTVTCTTLSALYYAGYFSIVYFGLIYFLHPQDLLISTLIFSPFVFFLIAGATFSYADIFIDGTPEEIRYSPRRDPSLAALKRVDDWLFSLIARIGLYPLLIFLLVFTFIVYSYPVVFVMYAFTVCFVTGLVCIRNFSDHKVFSITLMLLVAFSLVFLFGRYSAHTQLYQESVGVLKRGDLEAPCNIFFLNSQILVCATPDDFSVSDPSNFNFAKQK